MKLSKTDKKIFAKGRSQGKAAEVKRSKSRHTINMGAELFAAWAGQKFAADKMTPYFTTMPLHYTAGGLVMFWSMMGRPTDTKDTAGSLALGLVGGQLAVSGYKNQTSLPGMG